MKKEIRCDHYTVNIMHLPYDTADACQGGFRKNNDRCVCQFPEYRTDCDGNGKSIKCIRGQCICQYGFDL